MIISPGGNDVYDSFGVWANLGEVAPEYNVWEKFPVSTSFGNTTFRLSYSCADFTQIRSFAYLRVIYFNIDTQLATRSRKIYPKPNSEEISFPYNPEYRDRSTIYYSRVFEIKRLFRYRARIGYAQQDVLWSVKIEELLG